MAEAKVEKLVEVTVAPRRSIQTREHGQRAVVHGPGKKVQVLESDLPRLFKQGFIVDPAARKFTAEEIAAADVSAYVPKSGEVDITEKGVDQAVKKGKA